MKHFIVSIILLLSVLMMEISACAASDEEVTGTLNDVKTGEYSQRVEVTGNFDITFRFDSYDGDGNMWLEVYDKDVEDGKGAPNCILIRNHQKKTQAVSFVGTKHLGDEGRWVKKIAAIGDYNESAFPEGSGYELNVRRWNERLLLKLMATDGTIYMNMLYKPKADMKDTLYLKLYPSSMSISNISYSIGKTTSLFDTFCMSIEIILFVGITGFILIVAGNFFAARFSEDYFCGTFNNLVGGLWGLAVSVFLGLIIPKVRTVMEYLIGGLIGASNFVLPHSGSFLFWLILIVCITVIIAIWIRVVQGCGENPVVATLAMIPLGMLHGASMYIIIGLLFRMVLLGIALAVAYACFSAMTTSSTPANTTKGEEKIPNQLYDKDNRAYHVTLSGGTVFIRDNDGNDIALYKSGNHTYQDKDGREYHNWDLEN